MKSQKTNLRILISGAGFCLSLALAHAAQAAPHSGSRSSARQAEALLIQAEKDAAAQAAANAPTQVPSSGVSWLEVVLLLAVVGLAGLTIHREVRFRSFHEMVTSDILTHGNLLDDLKRKLTKDVSPRLTQCETTAKEASARVASYGEAFKTLQALPPFKARQLLEKAASEVTGRGDSWPGSDS